MGGSSGGGDIDAFVVEALKVLLTKENAVARGKKHTFKSWCYKRAKAMAAERSFGDAAVNTIQKAVYAQAGMQYGTLLDVPE